MALSNILREPRREITEQAVGSVVVIGFLALIPIAGLVMSLICDGTTEVSWSEFALCCLLGSFGFTLGFVLIAVLVVVAHEIGEYVCAALDRRGIYLRPTQRY